MNNHKRLRFRIINCINRIGAGTVRYELRQHGYLIIDLDGKHVRDKKSFFVQAAKDLPQPADLIAVDNWDALSDSMWWALSELDATRVAILWNDAHLMLDGGFPDLLMAISCFEDLAKSVATTESGFPRALSLHIFLIGEGSNFPDKLPIWAEPTA